MHGAHMYKQVKHLGAQNKQVHFHESNPQTNALLNHD